MVIIENTLYRIHTKNVINGIKSNLVYLVLGTYTVFKIRCYCKQYYVTINP